MRKSSTFLLVSLASLVGCDTLHSVGIGGEPLVMCRQGQAFIDDRILGPDGARFSLVRRLPDADSLCLPSKAL